MAEKIDIYDANLRHLGEMDRIEAHMQGKWHRTFHCWVLSAEKGGQVLLQKRADTMKNFPGLLDVSAAGHLEAGEPVEAGLREVTEELGIEVNRSHLHPLGERVEVADQSNGQRNREYQSVFLYQSDTPLSEYRAEPEEVSALLWLPINSGMRLLTGSESSLTLLGRTYEKSNGTSWEEFEMEVTADSFLPRIQQYYLTTLIMAERLLANAGPLAIS
ncbi:NUDIX domain-containing protein [Streptomyces sp. NPDC017979]|uniref:NUDIX hydrolase n=1 Tax=Streptomyces sp. NPDC017979 TaxID=3365024 RepID=UPI003791BFBB